MPPTLQPPTTDPAPLFELFRGNYATEILTAAVGHFHLFESLADQPAVSREELKQRLQLAERPLTVFFSH